MSDQLRLIFMGNAGVGKTTMARSILKIRNIPRLSLDEIAWGEAAVRKPHSESLGELMKFITQNSEWIIEGCYSDLIEEAIPFCTELRFLNPGVSTSISHCKKRPWEPEKFASREEQNQHLETLLEWVGQYETRTDEYGLSRHREIFTKFQGKKTEYKDVSEYD
jgi:adenylate kinase family enzyme